MQWVGFILGEVTSSQFTSGETVGLEWNAPEKMSFASIQTAKKIRTHDMYAFTVWEFAVQPQKRDMFFDMFLTVI